MVLRRCRALLRDEELAVDAMHDVFVEVLRRSAKLDMDHPSSFLYRSATNVCLNKMRSKRRKPAHYDNDLLERIACAPETEDRTGAKLWLDRIFEREPPSTRAMAVMHLLDGMTLEEVAQEHGMSVSGVRKRLRTLRAHVAELEGSLA
jgi:RNA polymerase sigma-70 factor (ECF subfamily)